MFNLLETILQFLFIYLFMEYENLINQTGLANKRGKITKRKL
jgi:hypothetical protein